MSEEKGSVKHNFIMNNRREISMTGVIDIISFDEEMIAAETEMGIIIIKGENFRINNLNIEKKELEAEGDINSINYEDSASYGKLGGSFFGKIFK